MDASKILTAKEATRKLSYQSEEEKLQVTYICKLYKYAKKVSYSDHSREPLLIMNANYRLPDGFAKIIGIHGFFSTKVVYKAILDLKDSGQLRDTIIQTTTDEFNKDTILAIKFIEPFARLV